LLSRAIARRPLEPARLAFRRALLRRQIRAVVTGRSQALGFDLADRELDPAALLAEATASMDPGGEAFRVLTSVLKSSGSTTLVLDGLLSRNPTVRARSARIAGLMRMEEAVPGIASLLWSREAAVRAAAAHALGTIGGIRSANALLKAIQRLGPRVMLIIALTRAAPDLYLETFLSAGQPRAIQPALALAAGLRGRRTAIAPLIAQAGTGSSRFRNAAGRALGWIGNPAGIPALTAALAQRDWRMRTSAAKALGSIASYQGGPDLYACLTDKNPTVRAAARRAMRKISRRPGVHGRPS